MFTTKENHAKSKDCERIENIEFITKENETTNSCEAFNVDAKGGDKNKKPKDYKGPPYYI